MKIELKMRQNDPREGKALNFVSFCYTLSAAGDSCVHLTRKYDFD